MPKNGLETDIKRAGGRFSVVGELWVSEATLDIAMPNPESVDLFDRKRYDDRRTEACAIIAEIYLDLKTDLRLILADPMQRVLFKTHVSLDLFLCRLLGRLPRLIDLRSSCHSSIKSDQMRCTERANRPT